MTTIKLDSRVLTDSWFSVQVSGPLNAGAPLNAISSFHGLNSLLRVQEQVVLIGNTDLRVGDAKQFNYFSFGHFKRKY